MRYFQHPSSFLLTAPGTLLWAACLALCFMLAPQAAWADSTERIVELLELAEEEYDMLFFEEAKEALQEGIGIVERERMRTREAAQLFMLLGIIRHADGEDSLAEDAFVRAIETYEDIGVDPVYSTPALEDLLVSAAERAEPPPTDADPDIAEPPPEEDVEPLTHTPLRRADAGESLMIIAEIPADLPVFRVHVHHRRYGESDFEHAEMDPTDDTGFALTLPANKVSTSQLEYFITASSRSGEILAESGRRTNPHRIAIIGDRGTAPSAEELSPEDRDSPEVSEPDATGFYGMLGAGTDIGFLPGGTSPTANPHRSVSPGITPAFAHSLLDLGWRITEENSIGLYFRWQFAPLQDFDQLPEDRFDDDAGFFQSQDECFGIGIPGDCLLGLKYQRVISTGFPEFYSSVGFGVGRVRNWLQLKNTTSAEDAQNESDPCFGRELQNDPTIGEYCNLRDTVRTGWVHFGVGGGMYFPVHDNFDIVADTYLMVHVPDTSVNIDFNLGVRFRL